MSRSSRSFCLMLRSSRYSAVMSSVFDEHLCAMISPKYRNPFLHIGQCRVCEWFSLGGCNVIGTVTPWLVCPSQLDALLEICPALCFVTLLLRECSFPIFLLLLIWVTHCNYIIVNILETYWFAHFFFLSSSLVVFRCICLLDLYVVFKGLWSVGDVSLLSYRHLDVIVKFVLEMSNCPFGVCYCFWFGCQTFFPSL